MCPPIRAHWQIRLKLVLPSAHPSTYPNAKLISSVIFAQLTAECHIASPGMSFPLIIAHSHEESGPHLIHASLGPPEFITQTASRSVQPFCTVHATVLSAMRAIVGACPSPQNYPFA